MKAFPLLALAASLLAATSVFAGDVHNVTPDEVEKLLKEKKDVVVLDVRTPAEFEDGHIAGAKNLDLHGGDFKEKVAALDKSKSYVVHCAAGSRSAKAVSIMEQDKFGQIYHMNGGMNAWQAAGKPVAK